MTASEVTVPEERRDKAQRQDAPIIDARHVAVSFKVEQGTVQAVKDVSFQLYKGETIAIVGEVGFRQVSDGSHSHGPSDETRHASPTARRSNSTAERAEILRA